MTTDVLDKLLNGNLADPDGGAAAPRSDARGRDCRDP